MFVSMIQICIYNMCKKWMLCGFHHNKPIIPVGLLLTIFLNQ